MIMSREDAFMDMMEEEIIIVQLKDKSLILRLVIPPITRITLMTAGDKFHLFYTLDHNFFRNHSKDKLIIFI